MALTVVDRGTFQSAQGGAITITTDLASGSFTCAAGAILVIGLAFNFHNTCGASSDVAANLSDTIADTGGGSWTASGASCTRGAVINGQYIERNEFYYRVIGTSPGSSKTVSFHSHYVANGTTTTDDGWQAGHLWEVTGQHATPVGLTASPSPVTSASTFNTDLGSVPASDSAVFGIGGADNEAALTIVQPSGWTESDDQYSSGMATEVEWAFLNGGSVQSPQWSGYTNLANNRIIGCAVEIKAAATAGFDVPLLHVPAQANVYRM